MCGVALDTGSLVSGEMLEHGLRPWCELQNQEPGFDFGKLGDNLGYLGDDEVGVCVLSFATLEHLECFCVFVRCE